MICFGDENGGGSVRISEGSCWATVLLIAMVGATLAGEDNFINGAEYGAITWAEGHCGRKIDKDDRNRLDAARARNVDEFDSGRRASEKSTGESVRESGVEETCAEVLKAYGSGNK